MPNFSSATIMGHMTRDPETRQAGQHTVTGFAVAVSRKSQGKDEVSFFDCKAWNKTGDFITKYFKKGDCILVQGELLTESWEDKNGGGRRSKVVIDVAKATFAGGKRAEYKPADDAPPNPDAEVQSAPAGNGDEIPF